MERVRKHECELGVSNLPARGAHRDGLAENYVCMRWLKTRDKTRKMVMHTRETDRTDESDVDDVLVTETCCPEVNFVLGWDRQDLADGRWREEGHLRGCEKGTMND